jgi:hypothetical protein
MNALDMSASMGTVFSRMSTMRTDGDLSQGLGPGDPGPVPS